MFKLWKAEIGESFYFYGLYEVCALESFKYDKLYNWMENISFSLVCYILNISDYYEYQNTYRLLVCQACNSKYSNIITT